jgi:superfamily II DNA or RNA helicase
MDRSLIQAPAAVVRAIIARAWLPPPSAITLGAITLQPHQCEAVARVRAALEEHGGALLADDVGLGKTYVALAVAAMAQAPLVVAPASLREMWAHASARANVPMAFCSCEALSRGSLPVSRHDLIVVDEAHHARTPTTARHRHLCRIGAGARLLLLSATPVHNSPRDLRALIALYAGARAWTADESDLISHVIRRQRDDVPSNALPTLTPPQPITVREDAALLDAIVALPPPVPPSDGGHGGALLSFTLARLWGSSHAALRAALRRRLQQARALEDSLACGRYPTSSELKAWTMGEDATQLAFPELLSDVTTGDVAELAHTVREHAAALDALLRRLPHESAVDGDRAARLHDVRMRHRDEKIVAFTQFSDTASMYFQHLRGAGYACQLDGRGAQVAGGRLSRRDALARFAPRATGAREPSRAERIDVLIATDLLSEGVNLQDASVVVHLDLPWTPARLEQRVGRSRRLGAQHAVTTVYAMMPPASSETLLRQEERLHTKMQTAARLTGACGAIVPVRLSLMPPSPEPTGSPAPARALQLVRTRVQTWSAQATTPPFEGAPRIACIHGTAGRALALVRRGGGCALIAVHGTRVSDDPADVLTAVQLAEGDDVPWRDTLVANALECIGAWIASSDGAATAGLTRTITGTARRLAMRRIAHIAAHTPHHQRAVVASLAAAARRVVTAPYGVGAENVLAELAMAPLSDAAWLRAVTAFGEANVRGGVNASEAGPATLDAMLVFVP